MATRILAPILLAIAVICTIPMVSRGAGNEDRAAPSKKVDIKTEFERLYLESGKTHSLSSIRETVISENPAYMKMIALGPRCLPFLMAKVDQGVPSAYSLIGVAEKILKVRPPKDPKMAIKGGEQRWLKGKLEKGYQEAEARFRKLQAAWAAAKAQSKDHVLWRDVTVLDDESKVLKVRREYTPLGKVYRDIQSLGLFVLPSLMEGLAAGRNTDFLRIVRFLTNGRAPIHGASPAVETKRCDEWWKKHKDKWTVPVAMLLVSLGLRARPWVLMVATGASPWYDAPDNTEARRADSSDGESLSKGNTNGAHVLNRYGIQYDPEHVWE